MIALFLSFFLLLGSGIVALVFSNHPRLATRLGAGGCLVSCILGFIPAVRILWGNTSEQIQFLWAVPFGSFSVGLDSLTAFFLIPLFGLSGLAAVYGSEYLSVYSREKNLGVPWFFYNLLVASMGMVIIARNAVLFLMAWEVMSVASYFLVTFEDEDETVRQAGWTYLIATHLGTVFLIVMFLLLGREAGGLDFDQFTKSLSNRTSIAGVLFILALIGFGTKAGFMPFHIWLPEAHPAAPSHVSAVMSGVMVKTGIYGILRILTFLGPPPAWWGVVLLGMGLVSGILGVIYALCQHDLKRLLAYHTVENIGIIALGLGLGMLGMSMNSPMLCGLGFGGGLLHVINHALFKGLLFLNAGAVLHATGTRQIDELGGLMKRMPWTGVTFLIGAVSISGLPPFNGFVSEWLIYLGAFEGGITQKADMAIACFTVIGGLALIGGLATACFSKAFGIVFLGESRSEKTIHAHETGMAMCIPMAVLACSCLALGILLPFLMGFLAPVISVITGFPYASMQQSLALYSPSLKTLVFTAFALISLTGIFAMLRNRILSGRSVDETVTWDCGYAQPTARMQYTASSFVQPFTFLFSILLQTKQTYSPPRGLFPHESSLHSETPDGFREGLYRPIFAGANWGLAKLSWLQHGRIQLYILYIALTLLILLVWKLG